MRMDDANDGTHCLDYGEVPFLLANVLSMGSPFALSRLNTFSGTELPRADAGRPMAWAHAVLPPSHVCGCGFIDG